MHIPERDVLNPVGPSVSEDEWPEFVLSDASVVYESNGKPANLLLAYSDVPLRVQGRLQAPPRGHTDCLVKKPYKPTDIAVRNVTRYAYAELPDQTFLIWALGEAGWFEIQPAPQYKAIYDDMLQAVQLLYFVTDIYNEPRKRGGGPGASLIYQEYAEDDRFPCTDPAEAERIFYKHRNFLLMSFLTRTNNIGWSNTPLYQTMRRQFPKDFETCKARHEGRFTDIKAERVSRSTRTSPAPATTARPTSERAQPSKGKRSVAKMDEPPKKDDNWWEASVLFEFMQKAVNQRVIRAGRNSITVERVAQLIVKRYEIDNVETARNVLLVHAQNLCYLMDHPRRQSIRFFAAEPIYGELAPGPSLSAAEQRRAQGVELRPRKDHGTLRGEDSESSDTSDEEDDMLSTPVRRLPGRSKKGTLSVLRPKSGKFSGKGKSVNRGGKGKTKPPIPVSSSSSSSPSPSSSQEDTTAINTPTCALSPGPAKRKLDTAEGKTEGKRQRAHSSPTAPSSPPTSEDETAQAGTADSLPLRHHPGTTQAGSRSTQPMLPAIVSTPLPTYESNGPRDSWICSFDGCAQKIYGCSKEMGRQLITEHLEDHTKGREKVVGILWREQDKLHLPVDNLIKRIREMSEATTPLFPGLDTGKGLLGAVQRSA